ncbi:MAG: tRNA1(Val) (adenine(37)-N6)-methyltransferase [Oscillospiraceae bacterium]
MNNISGLKTEKIGSAALYISAAHRFGTDAVLLADFAAPRRKDTVCDLCTGCGIVAVVMHERFQPKYIEAVEIDREGHELLNMTIENSGLDGIKAVCGDLKEWKSERELDLITCNPPYKRDGAGIKSEERVALGARHEVLCSLSDVCRAAAASLKYGGRLCICNRPERLCDIMCDMRSAGIEPKRVRFVSKNPYTSPWLVLVEGRKGGKPFLQTEPTFFTHNPDGTRTAELEKLSEIML